MPKQFWTFLGIGVAIIGIAIAVVLWTNKGSHLELDGKILKVRTLSLEPQATILVIDFRVTNPANYPYMIKDAVVRMDTADGKTVQADTVSRDDTDRLFQYHKILGPKYNQTLIQRDQIPAHHTEDRTLAVRVPASSADVDKRKGLHLTLDEVDGAVSEIAEQR